MATETATAKETLGFQTEVKQLLHLMIHSLYSNREIFLRELISNASDATDKLRYEALHNSALLENDPNLEIRVDFDKDKKTVTVTDNGIGMNREDVITHLGHHCQIWYSRVFTDPDWRSKKGFTADWSVRGRFLFRFYCCGQSGC